MLKFIKIQESENHVMYNYYPEGKKEFGVIECDKFTAKPVKHQIASNDETKWYYYHMLDKIREMAKSKEYSDKGMVAWY